MGNFMFVYKLTPVSLRGCKQINRLNDHLFCTDSSKSTYLSILFGFFKPTAFSSHFYACAVLTLISSEAVAA